jgi:hypothetical protein
MPRPKQSWPAHPRPYPAPARRNLEASRELAIERMTSSMKLKEAFSLIAKSDLPMKTDKRIQADQSNYHASHRGREDREWQGMSRCINLNEISGAA